MEREGELPLPVSAEEVLKCAEGLLLRYKKIGIPDRLAEKSANDYAAQHLARLKRAALGPMKVLKEILPELVTRLHAAGLTRELTIQIAGTQQPPFTISRGPDKGDVRPWRALIQSIRRRNGGQRGIGTLTALRAQWGVK